MFISTILLLGLYLRDCLSCDVRLIGSSVATVGISRTYTCKFESCIDCSHSWRVDDNIVTSIIQNKSCIETTGSNNETVYDSDTTLTYTWRRPTDSSDNQQNVTCQHASVDTTSIFLTVDIHYGPGEIDSDTGNGYNYTLTEGENTPKINCRATCNPACTLEFLDAKSRIYPNPLHFPNISKEKTGYYTCRARNSVGIKISSSSVYLNVQYKPEVSVTISPANLDEGSTAMLKCTATGNPEISMILMEHYSGNSKIRTLQNYSQENNAIMYRLPNVSYQDSGIYKCVVLNDISTSVGELKLQVKITPLVLMKTKSIVNLNNGSSEMGVDFMSDGYTPVIRWLKLPNVVISENHRTLIQSLSNHTSVITRYNVSVQSLSYRCNLLIMDKTSKDDGIYIASIRNSLGEQIVQFEIGDNSDAVSPGTDQGSVVLIAGAVMLACALVILILSLVFFIRYKRRELRRRKNQRFSNTLPSADELNLQQNVGSSTSNLIQRGSEFQDSMSSGYISVQGPDLTLDSIPGDVDNSRQYQNQQFPSKSQLEGSNKYQTIQCEGKDPKYENIKHVKDTNGSDYANLTRSGDKSLYENQ